MRRHACVDGVRVAGARAPVACVRVHTCLIFRVTEESEDQSESSPLSRENE